MYQIYNQSINTPGHLVQDTWTPGHLGPGTWSNSPGTGTLLGRKKTWNVGLNKKPTPPNKKGVPRGQVYDNKTVTNSGIS